MILGTACSKASTIMGQIAERHLNITQVRNDAYISQTRDHKHTTALKYRLASKILFV